MHDVELERIANQLAEYSHGRDGECRITNGTPWPWLSLNRDGCIAMSAALLRLASTPIPANRDSVTVPLADLEQINEAPYDLELFAIQRVESFTQDRIAEVEMPDRPWRVYLGIAGSGISIALFILFFVTGLVNWVSWLLSSSST